jgi:hypothetical protein
VFRITERLGELELDIASLRSFVTHLRKKVPDLDSKLEDLEREHKRELRNAGRQKTIPVRNADYDHTLLTRLTWPPDHKGLKPKNAQRYVDIDTDKVLRELLDYLDLSWRAKCDAATGEMGGGLVCLKEEKQAAREREQQTAREKNKASMYEDMRSRESSLRGWRRLLYRMATRGGSL